MELQIKCSLCNSELSDPRLLECLHSFCFNCVQQVKRENEKIICPTCLNETTSELNELPQDFMKTKTENRKVVCCDQCKIDPDLEPEPAISFCSQCNLQLCDFHVIAHKRNKKTNSHELSTLEQQKAEIMCSEHPLKVIEFYCSTPNCSKLVCSSCVIGIHKSHKYQSISDAATNQKNNILTKTIITSKKQIEQLEKTMNTRTLMRSDVEMKCSQEFDKVNREINRLIGVLEKETTIVIRNNK